MHAACCKDLAADQGKATPHDSRLRTENPAHASSPSQPSDDEQQSGQQDGSRWHASRRKGTSTHAENSRAPESNVRHGADGAEDGDVSDAAELAMGPGGDMNSLEEPDAVEWTPYKRPQNVNSLDLDVICMLRSFP